MTAIDHAAEQGLISKKTYESRFDGDLFYNIFTCELEEEEGNTIENAIPLEVLGQLQEVIKKFGEDTPSLLDYVYFETEPMEGVKKGDILDFSKVRSSVSRKVLEPKQLSEEKIALAKKHIAALVQKMKQGKERLKLDTQEAERWKDDNYYHMLDLMDGEDLSIGLSGTAKIDE